jgi:threonine dehydrogenase-like Zn-dependent dehydrogenase
VIGLHEELRQREAEGRPVRVGLRPERHGEALEAIAKGRIRADRFITHRFPLEEVTDAFATAGGWEALKVVITARMDSMRHSQ